MNGLSKWRQRQAEWKAKRMAELAEYRETATEETRDGRTYLVVRVPDQYSWQSQQKEEQ